MKKKLTAVALVIALVALAIAGGTLAYFTAQDTASNKITTGSIDIEVIEEMKTDNGNVTYPYTGEDGAPVLTIMPGHTQSKIVTVKNTGSSNAFIRVKIEKAWKNADSTTSAIPEAVTTDALALNMVSTKWVKVGDYYYYSEAVAPNAITEVLFDSFTFGSQYGNDYANLTADIVVSADAIQTENGAAEAAWGVKIAGGTVTAVTP